MIMLMFLMILLTVAFRMLNMKEKEPERVQGVEDLPQ